MPTSSEWMYFASGALLPSLAYCYFFVPRPLPNGGPRRSASASAGDPSSSAQTAASRSSVKSNTDAARANEPTHRQSDNNEEEEDDDDDYDEDDNSSSSEQDVPGTNRSLACSEWGYSHAPYKMMLVVNQELNMGKGKIAAQCGHASVGCYKRSLKMCPNALKAWEHTGCAKIAVKCPTTSDLETIAALARSMDVPLYLVEDAGRTQIAAGSRTVLGLFGPAFVFGPLTDHLKLM
jgi:peptidyl-tRNA hydrolase, PTH2 family